MLPDYYKYNFSENWTLGLSAVRQTPMQMLILSTSSTTQTNMLRPPKSLIWLRRLWALLKSSIHVAMLSSWWC